MTIWKLIDNDCLDKTAKLVPSQEDGVWKFFYVSDAAKVMAAIVISAALLSCGFMLVAKLAGL